MVMERARSLTFVVISALVICQQAQGERLPVLIVRPPFCWTTSRHECVVTMCLYQPTMIVPNKQTVLVPGRRYLGGHELRNGRQGEEVGDF